MTAASRRFAFDTVFAKNGAIVEGGDDKRFTAAELDAARAAGVEKGRAEAAASFEAELGAALKDLVAQLRSLSAGLDQREARIADGAAALAFAAAKKIGAEALEAFGEARAEAIIREALTRVVDQPRLTVRLSPRCAEALEAKLGQMLQEEGFHGFLRVKSEAALRRGDVSLDWGEAGLSIGAADIEERIQATLESVASGEQA